MFYIIEKEEQLKNLEVGDKYLIEIIPNNSYYHPKLQTLSLIYIRDINFHKGYLLCINHNDSLSLSIKQVKEFISKIPIIFTSNKKNLLYLFEEFKDKIIDINLYYNLLGENLDNVEEYNTNFHNFIYNKNQYLKFNNEIISLPKHYEKYENYFNYIKPYIKGIKNINKKWNNLFPYIFYKIEKEGIKIHSQKFPFHFFKKIKTPEINIKKPGIIYSQYNLYNTTNRPTNSFNGINFMALNKKNKERESFIPKNDYFIEFDYSAFHLILASKIIKYNFNSDNIHIYLGKQYFNKNILTEEEYKKSKIISFRQLNGEIQDKYKNIPFFKKVEEYKNKIWNNNKNYIILPTGKILLKENQNKNKLFNYILQHYETYYNIDVLYNIINLLENKKSKIILYNYDSILLDFDKNEKEILYKIKEIMKLPIKIHYGKDYNNFVLLPNF